MEAVTSSEMWILAKLEDVTEILDSSRIPINHKERHARISGKPDSELFPYYGATGEVGKIDDYLFDEELVALGEDGVPFLDPRKPKAYLLEGKTWVNNHAHVLKGYPNGLSNKVLLHYLNQFDYQGYVNGGTRLKLTQANMRGIPFPLPPLAEQKVIAEKLDTLLAQVDTTKARLERIPDIIKRFRQSVLAAAVSGKLTEEWRMTNSCEEALSLIEETSIGNRSKKELEIINKPLGNEEILLDIPESWAWTRLSRITEIASGVAKGGKGSGEQISLPYLRVANVQRGYLDLEEIKNITVSKDKAEKLYLKFGDVLFNEGGDLDKLGRGWIWEEQIENCIHQNHVFRARVCSSLFEPKFISYYGNSEGKEYFYRNGTQSVNLASINKTVLSLLPVPVPPAKEQTEIVRRVEELFAFADTIELKAAAALERVNNLTQSILAKAFRGELTADWRAANPELISGDNSAEALLVKIQAEREALKPVKKTRKKKAKA